MEYARFHGEIPRGEYGAGRVTIWDHGTYEVLKWDDREVKVALHGQRVSGGYVLFATGGKNWMIHRERLPLPATLTPMLAAPGKPPLPDAGRVGVEMKWDGVRALAFIEAGRLRLVSRTGKDITATYPEVAGLGQRDRPQAGAARRRDRRLHRRPAGLRGAAAPDARLVARRRPSGWLELDPGHVPGVRRAATGRAAADRPRRTLSAGKYSTTIIPNGARLALPAQVPRRGPGRGPGRLGRQRARGRGDQAARLALRAGRPVRQLAQDQEPAPPGGRGGRLEARQGQPDRADRLAAHRRTPTGDGRGLRYCGHVGHRVLRRDAADARPGGSSRCAGRTARSTARCRPSMPGPRSG